MPRAFLLVLDSVGIGSAPDAGLYGDAGSNTVGHIAEACAAGVADRHGTHTGGLKLPNLARLGRRDTGARARRRRIASGWRVGSGKFQRF